MSTPTTEDQPMLTPIDAATLCSLSARTIHRLIQRGEIRAHRLGRSLRISPPDLNAWLSASRIEPMPAAPCLGEGGGSFRQLMKERRME